MNLYTSKVTQSDAFSMINAMSQEFVNLKNSEVEENDFLINNVYLRVQDKCSGSPTASVFPKTIRNRTSVEVYKFRHKGAKRENNDFHFKTNAKVVLELYQKAANYKCDAKGIVAQSKYQGMENSLIKFAFFYNKLANHVFLRKFEEKNGVLLKKLDGQTQVIDSRNGLDIKGPRLEKLARRLELVEKKIRRFQIRTATDNTLQKEKITLLGRKQHVAVEAIQAPNANQTYHVTIKEKIEPFIQALFQNDKNGIRKNIRVLEDLVFDVWVPNGDRKSFGKYLADQIVLVMNDSFTGDEMKKEEFMIRLEDVSAKSKSATFVECYKSLLEKARQKA